MANTKWIEIGDTVKRIKDGTIGVVKDYKVFPIGKLLYIEIEGEEHIVAINEEDVVVEGNTTNEGDTTMAETKEGNEVDDEATVVIAEAITKARWGSLKTTVEDIATECDTTTDNVNNVIASETYLNVIRETFDKRKGWRTWAKKGASIVAKRLWITEEQATTIIEGINK